MLMAIFPGELTWAVENPYPKPAALLALTSTPDCRINEMFTRGLSTKTSKKSPPLGEGSTVKATSVGDVPAGIGAERTSMAPSGVGEDD
jgi:hypothetical protein